MRPFILVVACIIAFVAAAGCSGQGNGTGVSPDLPNLPQKNVTAEGNYVVLGTWQVAVNKNTGEINIIEQRQGNQLLNVLSFMEPPPFSNLSIDWNTLVLDPANNYLEVVVKFTHPFVEPDHVFWGFDVRGIVFGPELLNADGYTPALSPQYFSGFPFGYIDGVLGAPHSWAGYYGDRWPYKYFALGIDPYQSLNDYFQGPGHIADRGQFPEGATISRFYQLDFGSHPGDFLVFNYAVMASFDWPVGAPPFDVTDFPIETCNTPEPFNVSATVVENTLFYGGGQGGGQISIDAEVFDWQGAESCEVYVGSFDGTSIPETLATSSEPGTTAYSRIFHFVDVTGNPNHFGELDCYIKGVEPSITFGQAWMFGCLPAGNHFYDIPVYNIFPLTGMVGVMENAPPVWNPVLTLADGFGTLCRDSMNGVPTAPYSDANSNYDFTTRWDYTGGEPSDPEGDAWIKFYYISKSPTQPEGSSVGWVEFTTVGYLEMNWQYYWDIAPDRVYLWVRADDENGAYSQPVRWTNDGGEIELCHLIKGWDSFPPGHWSGNYSSAGSFLYLYVLAGGSVDAYIYDNESWQLGSADTTDVIKVEFTRSNAWTLNTNELSLRASNDGELIPGNVIDSWTGSYPAGAIIWETLPSTIGGSDTIGSSRAFGFYLDDLSLTASGVAYIDYMGIYSHPL